MGKRDWAGTVFVACLIALAGLLHDHTVPLALLSAGATVSGAIVVWDVLHRRGKPRASRRSLWIAKVPTSIRIPLRAGPRMEVSEVEAGRIAADRNPKFAPYRAFPEQKPAKAQAIEHEPIRWDQIGDRPEPGEEEVPLEPWLEDRIAAHRHLVHQRAVRGDKWFLGALHGWDVRNTHELLTKVAPDLVSGYRGDPPGHLPGQEASYYERQLGWLNSTLRSLQEDASRVPVARQDEEPAPARTAEGGGRQQEAERLAALYREGEQLRASILWSTASIPGDLMRGSAGQRQVERERLARDWDDRVLGALPADARKEWGAASTLSEPHPTRSLIEHTSTITGVREHLAAKLAASKTSSAASTLIDLTPPHLPATPRKSLHPSQSSTNWARSCLGRGGCCRER